MKAGGWQGTGLPVCKDRNILCWLVPAREDLAAYASAVYDRTRRECIDEAVFELISTVPGKGAVERNGVGPVRFEGLVEPYFSFIPSPRISYPLIRGEMLNDFLSAAVEM
ncbi:hypothetical protein [Prosthecochloris sp. HL-130-GSB]|uniref:hypothetical protein n=1 Tax=Prosthecochloris sp. HL-130-GSB TaxID=1974213 RepID=UPI000A1C0AAB|nr:hypothetical protein [Prosthecochloris sp. HL-130-GSB]ARM31577.1 hypothetical protein B9H02_10065 [Prosthecochloris sp. HL-130-GSB]